MPIRTITDAPGAWAETFRRQLIDQYHALKLSPPDVLSVIGPDRARPELLVYFGEQAPPNAAVAAQLATYAAGARHLLPVIDDAPAAPTHLPPSLMRFNAFLRKRHEPHWCDALVDQVLALTWQRRPERNIFISYRRKDAEGVARQLHDRYSKLSMNVFLDDYDIPRAVDFQVELRRHLDDSDAVLLLGSPELGSSPWCREEIEIALTRRIGLLAVAWPEARFSSSTPEPPVLKKVPADRLFRLKTADLDSATAPGVQTLPEEALTEIDRLLFTGRSLALASRLRDLVDVAREQLSARFEVRSARPDGDFELVEKTTSDPWLAMVLPFQPEVANVFSYWDELRLSDVPRKGLVVVYPQLDATDARSRSLREMVGAWGAAVSPRVELMVAQDV